MSLDLFDRTCRIVDRTQSTTVDSEWGQPTTEATEVTVYSGGCRAAGYDARIDRSPSGDKDTEHDNAFYLEPGEHSFDGWPPKRDHVFIIDGREGRIIRATDYTRDFYTRVAVLWDDNP